MSWVPQTSIPASGVAGGATAAGFPWAIVIPAALSLLSSSGLFGETQTQRQKRMMEELLAMIKPQQEYLAGRFREFDPIVAKALQAQLGRTRGWGWPAEPEGGV
ncbi:hypothetical protein ES703_95617 [subsurface metagenome]